MLWYQNNADHKKQYVREWRLENPNYGWELVSSHPDECRETRARYRMNHPFERREASHLRRLAIKGVDAERFDYGEIFERDNWICGLCDRPINSELRWPDPMSVSLDHVVPISRGGKHEIANAQASHLRCNMKKGNR